MALTKNKHMTIQSDFIEQNYDIGLFIFDLDIIKDDKYLNGEPLPLAIFIQLIDVFKDIGVDGYMFKYVPNENLIICNSRTITVEYIESLKEKVKAEYSPVYVEKEYKFNSIITSQDVLSTEIEFMRTYNVEPHLLCSTNIDYDTKTVTIKSRSASVKRTIPYFASKLIESCIYIPNGLLKVNTKIVKYPYRDLIKQLRSTDFVSRTIAVSIPKEDEVMIDMADMQLREYASEAKDTIVVNSLEKEYEKPEDANYKETIDDITEDQINKFLELNRQSIIYAKQDN